MPGKQEELACGATSTGNYYEVASGECKAGKTVRYEMCSELEGIQDRNERALGFYVRYR